MSKNYAIKIPGKNFKYIKPTDIDGIWSNFPKSQCPIRYDRANKRVLLISNNIADITPIKYNVITGTYIYTN